MINKNGNYYNGRGERINNPDAYSRAVSEDRYGYNRQSSYKSTRSKYYGGRKF